MPWVVNEPSSIAAELVKVVLTQWVLSLMMYELFAAAVDPEDRLLPTLGF